MALGGQEKKKGCRQPAPLGGKLCAGLHVGYAVEMFDKPSDVQGTRRHQW